MTFDVKNALMRGTVNLAGKARPVDMAQATTVEYSNLKPSVADQPGLLAYYGELRALALLEYNDARDEAKLTEATLREETRDNLARQGVKITVDTVNDAVTRNPIMLTALAKQREAEYTYERMNAAFQAVKDRGMALGILASIYKTELDVNSRM